MLSVLVPNLSHLFIHSPFYLTYIACFVVNLVSGLIIAEVAIKQYEASRTQVPSSFQELAEVNFHSKLFGNGVAAISLFVNVCVTTFDLSRIGDVLAAAFQTCTGFTMDTTTTTAVDLAGRVVDPSMVCSVGYAALLMLTTSKLSPKQLGNLAGVACTGLFVTLAAILLPGLAAIHDPWSVFLAPGTASDPLGAAGLAAPVLLSAMVYQNIVPSVTKRLNYDRQQTTAALVVGSFLPSMIYVLYSYVVLGGATGGTMEHTGGGLEGSTGFLMTAFSITTIVGSSVACVMSMSEELENFVNSNKKDVLKTKETDGRLLQEAASVVALVDTHTISSSKEEEEELREEPFSIPTVLFAVGVPLSIGIAVSGGNDLTVALRIAGSYGSPLLYGALPVALAWNQRQKFDGLKDMLPGGYLSLGCLASLTAIYMAEEVTKDVSGLLGC